jgi:NADH-quinone oxidoreductase subunit C
MNEKLASVIGKVKDQFPVEIREFRDEVTLLIKPEQLLPVCQLLKNRQDFAILLSETAVDYWPQETPRFHLVYHLYNIKTNHFLVIRVPLDGNAPVASTLESIYPNANWYEREIWDMFGIRFEGHSDLRRILMPQDWQGHPQRKDYPLGYEEVQFTFNFDQISLRKPAPGE